MIPGFKKKVKMKNLSVDCKANPPYDKATFSLVNMEEEPAPLTRNEDSRNIFTDYFDCGTVPPSKEEQTDRDTGIMLEDANGIYKDLVVNRRDSSLLIGDNGFGYPNKERSIVQKKLNDQPLVVLTDYLTNESYNKIEIGQTKPVQTSDEKNEKTIINPDCQDYLEKGYFKLGQSKVVKETKHKMIFDVKKVSTKKLSFQSLSFKAENAHLDVVSESQKMIKKKKKTVNPLQLKVIRKNGKLQMVNFDNNLITFCGDCVNCLKKEDCGECPHCR